MLLLLLTLDEMNTTISVVNFFATAMFLFFPRIAIFKGKLQLTFGAMVLNCSRDLRPLYSLFCSLLCGGKRLMICASTQSELHEVQVS